MTHNGKKLWLCDCCDEIFSCQEACPEAIKANKEDHSANYMDSKEYKPKGTSTTFYDMRRGTGGLSKFK